MKHPKTSLETGLKRFFRCAISITTEIESSNGNGYSLYLAFRSGKDLDLSQGDNLWESIIEYSKLKPPVYLKYSVSLKLNILPTHAFYTFSVNSV